MITLPFLLYHKKPKTNWQFDKQRLLLIIATQNYYTREHAEYLNYNAKENRILERISNFGLKIIV